MAYDEDFMQEAEDDAATVAFIRNYLPSELKDKFTDDELYYFIDVMADYYTTSGVLDAKPDKDGYIEIDADAVVDYIVKQARKENMGEYDPEDILFVVQGEMEYGESLEQ